MPTKIFDKVVIDMNIDRKEKTYRENTNFMYSFNIISYKTNQIYSLIHIVEFILYFVF